MGFFERLLGDHNRFTPPDIPFGRYSDAYRSEQQNESFDLAVAQFEQKNYLEAFRCFFEFLRDKQTDNVRFWEDEEGLRFELLQGSKKVSGIADEERLEVETKVAKVKALGIDFMKRLMEKNYTLRYSRFALDGQGHIVMKFNTHVLDGSPYKLYDALKELALNADKLDDLLLDEYATTLEPIDTGHIEPIPFEEKNIKYRYLKDWINQTLIAVDALPDNAPAASTAYLLMSLCYKIDYLLQPQGVVMETLERINRLYFARDERTMREKNKKLYEAFTTIENRPKEAVLKEFYRTTATFGVTQPVGHEQVQGVIDGELPKMGWFVQQNQSHVALALGSYIVGYCLFNFAAPEPDRDFFHLFYEIFETAFFSDLGFQVNYNSLQKLNESEIKQKILEIERKYRKSYPNLKPNVSSLKFNTTEEFVQTYLEMIRQLDYDF